MKGTNFTIHGFGQQRLQIAEPHFEEFLPPQTFSCWKIRFQTEVCSCSNFPTEAMLWIKEVEMAFSVDDLKYSRSPFPYLELLDARCIIPEQDHPEFLLQEEVQSGGTEGSESRPKPSRKTDRLLDLRLLPGHWRQRVCARLFRLLLCCSSE